MTFHDQLGDPVTFLHMERVVPVGVDEDDLDFSPIRAVHDAGEYVYAVLGCQSRTWGHATVKALGNLKGYPCGYGGPLARVDHEGLGTEDVRTRVGRVRPRGRPAFLFENFDADPRYFLGIYAIKPSGDEIQFRPRRRNT